MEPLHLTLEKPRQLSNEEQDSCEAMTKAIVQKILHDPIQCLKRNAHSKGDSTQLIHELFRLGGEEPE